MLRLPLGEASAKVRSGGPLDDAEDYELPIWAGTVGLRIAASSPKPDNRLLPNVELPSYISELSSART